MGGNAAKERRRLKRLSETGGEDIEEHVKQKRPAVDKKAEHDVKIPMQLTKSTKDSSQNTNIKLNKKAMGHKSADKLPFKTKTTIAKTKVKKPKHLARKMQLAQDPKIRQELEKKQKSLELKKVERAKKFRDKVIILVGGVDHFDEKAFQEVMAKGGGKLESIVEASKKSSKSTSINRKDEGLASTVEQNKSSVNFHSSENLNSSSHQKDEKDDDATNVIHSSTTTVLSEVNGTTNKQVSSDESSSSNSSSSESDSSDDETNLESEKRTTRGRRRRGLKDIDMKREALKLQQYQEEETRPEENHPQNYKTEIISQDKRRCIGRKPLTDFEVGKIYSGTIQYVKPNLGLFIDIGCHSDAFCHISRASDDYIDSLDTLFQKGQALTDIVRIVDVDRKTKRITVSLQSDKKIADEEKSQREYNERRQANQEKKKRAGQSKMTSHVRHDSDKKHHHFTAERVDVNIKEESNQKWEREDTPIVIDPNTMTPAEIKRARKLQRRQERRSNGLSNEA